MMHHRKQSFGIFTTLFLALGMMASIARAQNPTPFINEISPVAATPGASAFTLTVNGTGFVSGAVVNWKVGTTTTPLATTVVSATQVTAAVPASLVATAGTASVTVVNSNTTPLEGTSNIEFFQITTPTSGVAFTTASSPTVGSDPSSVAVGDFNGDGKLDLAVANSGSNTVSILLGNGDGTFNAGQTLNVGGGPISISVGDFNGDGILDLAVVNNCGSDPTCNSAGTVSILLGNGNGTFTAAPGSPTVGYYPISVAVGDFNGDGILDLAVANECGYGPICSTPGTVSILLGNGTGTFTPAPGSPVVVGDNPISVAVGDFGNGYLDLAVVNKSDNTVSILLGNGNGTFNAGQTLNVGIGPNSVAVGDFNVDGILDLAVANVCGSDPTCSSPGAVSILLGNGNGTFTAASGPLATVGYGASSVAVGDFNGDGKLDLTVANFEQNTVSILLGNGNGTFSAGQTPNAGVVPNSVAVGDFNVDGRLDLAVINPCGSSPTCSSSGTVSILVQQPIATLSSASLSFGNQAVGTTSSTQSVTLTAGAPMSTASIAVTSGSPNFTLATTATSCPYSGGTLAAGASCTVDVEFVPTAAGTLSGAITLTDNSGGVANSTQTVNLSGTGTIAVASLSPASLNFAGQTVRTTSTAQTVTLMNNGGAPLAITGVAVSAGFAESNTCGSSLAAGGSCMISVTFTPTATGTVSGMLSVIDNSNGVANSTQTVMLSGTGLGGFTITPTPSTETIKRGVLGGFILTLKSLDGFKGPVILSCSGGPAGSYCADLPQTVNLHGTAYAVSGILFPKNSAPGTYTITFTGKSGVITEDATATFIVK